MYIKLDVFGLDYDYIMMTYDIKISKGLIEGEAVAWLGFQIVSILTQVCTFTYLTFYSPFLCVDKFIVVFLECKIL